MIGVTFGPTTTTSGGKALRFYTSMRLEVRRIGAVKSGETIVGNRTQVKVAKNKMAPPFRKAEFDIVYGSGFDWAADLVDLGVEAGRIDKSGAWFSMDGERLGQGRTRAAEALVGSPERALELQRCLYATAGLSAPSLRLPKPAAVGEAALSAGQADAALRSRVPPAPDSGVASQLGFEPPPAATPTPAARRSNGTPAIQGAAPTETVPAA